KLGGKTILQLFVREARVLYILRESQKFLVELLDRLGDEDLDLAGNIMPPKCVSISRCSPLNKDNMRELSCQHSLRPRSSSFSLPVISHRDLHSLTCERIQCPKINQLLWMDLNIEKYNEMIAGKVSRLLTFLYFAGLERDASDNKIPYMTVKAMEKKIYNLLALHISRKSVINFMSVTVQCQFCWNKIYKSVSTDNQSGAKHFNFDTQLIVFQVLPMLTCLRNKKNFSNNECLEMFTNKIFQLTSEDTQRLAYTYRDLLLLEEDKNKYAHQAMLSILQIKDIINRAFMYNLKDYIINEPSATDGLTGPEFAVQHPEQLGAVLDGLTSLIRAFQITWRESVETICLFGFTQLLMRNPNLSPKVSIIYIKINFGKKHHELCVQGLQLMQVAIQNFMPPNLALLMNTLKGSSIDQLGPILHKRLHDINWDVRDSALEVLQVVTSIAEIRKFPAFQDHVVENELCPLVLVLAMDDTESYVRASAIKCLCAMVRVQRFWTDCLASQNLPKKMMAILQDESEGIVRREAAALLKEIYVHHKFLKAELGKVFTAMARAAMCDLHWEVKINALHFWEKVIEQQMSNQGMIDGIFPSVTFSKENRKIVTLTETEIKTRLNKVLEELCRIRCLQVLLTALQDHDLQVVYKAADIITTLNKVLRRHGLASNNVTSQPLPDLVSNCTPPNFRGVYDSYGCEVNGMTKTNVDSGEKESRFNHSEKIIESIVNETDINLLAAVYQDRLNVDDQASGIVCPPENNVTVEKFLSSVSKLNLEEFIAQKSRWMDYCTDDLGSLLDDILSSRADKESNAMDCY
ncbi:hypothetical protein L9F63_004156, partial [Diploptera punctata]